MKKARFKSQATRKTQDYIGHNWMIVVGDFICMLLEHLGIRGRNAHIM
jgi:hypothetical protein